MRKTLLTATLVWPLACLSPVVLAQAAPESAPSPAQGAAAGDAPAANLGASPAPDAKSTATANVADPAPAAPAASNAAPSDASKKPGDDDPLDERGDDADAQTDKPASATEPAPDAAPAVAAPAAAPPPHDPIIAAVRAKLESAPAKGRDAALLAALKEYYAASPDGPLWIETNGFTAKGTAVSDEFRKAEDWGLSASAFESPAGLVPGAPPEEAAESEIKFGVAALKYATHARGGRVDPLSISKNWDRKLNLPDPNALIRELAASSDPAALLRSHHPKHEQFELLRQALLKARGPEEPKPVEEEQVELPKGPSLKPGASHPDIALLRKRLKVAADPGQEFVLDDPLVGALRAFQKEKGLKASGMLTPAARNALNGVKEKKPTKSGEIQRILVNMERWRWMPDDLGAFYVWDNVPEFMMKAVKNGETVFSEKIIVGKPENATPNFSADMLYVIFHPEWGVPDGIKMTEILPYLRQPSGDFFFGWGGADTRVLERHNLRVSYNGRPVNAATVDWNSVNIRRYSFTQPPGPTNVLGVVKFRFPNRHDVYMHDTPQRELFGTTNRAHSHGCIRVQDPIRFAEVLLEQDQGMAPAAVRRLVSSGSNQVDLKTPIPVHIVYFTAVAEKDGKLRTFGDLYGTDARLASALEGRAVQVADAGVASDGGAPAPRPPRTKKRQYQPSNDIADVITGLFGN